MTDHGYKNGNNHRSLFRRFGGWALGVIAATILALSIDWAKYFAGPGSIAEAESDRFKIAGMTIECNAPISQIVGDRAMRIASEDDSFMRQSIVFLMIAGTMERFVYASGEQLKRYYCEFSDPRFYIEFSGLTAEYETGDGQRCKQVTIARSHTGDDEGNVQFHPDKVFFSKLHACLSQNGDWETIHREEQGSARR